MPASRVLSLDEVRQALEARFLPLEPTIVGMRLRPSRLREDELVMLEADLATRFPPSFRDALLRFDFSNLTIGPVAFGAGGAYLDELRRWNLSPRDFPWWGDGERPKHLILIANSDPYAVLLDVQSGDVLAWEHGQLATTRRAVARDFELFLRGLGTTLLNRSEAGDNDELGRMVAAEVCSQDLSFWQELAR